MRVLLSIIILGLIHQITFSQTITLKEDSIQFDRLIGKIEAQSTCKFFYSLEWTKAIYLNVDFESLPLDSVIHWLSVQVKLDYCITHNNKVVFVKDSKIRTNYAESYADYLLQIKNSQKDSIIYYRPGEEDENSSINEEYLLYTIGNLTDGQKHKNATLSGKIRDKDTGEPIVGAVVFVEQLKAGTTSDAYGFYSIVLPDGQYKIEFQLVGMKSTSRNIAMLSDGQLNIDMKSSPTALTEVVVTAKSEDPVRNLRMGMEKISMKTLKQLPLGMGEPDVIKSTLLLPGVQSVGEASGGFNVRGGSVDQNLVLFNDAPILNTSHFFGFFSGFNSDAIKDITLYKSGIPSKYGGRVSSVLDITLKEGNRKALKINGGISPVSGRIMVEGPIKKDVSSFILGFRTTYSDWVLKLLNDGKLNHSKANFYDLQGNFSWDIDPKNAVYVSGYYSSDRFDYYSEDAVEYKSFASTVRLKHTFNPKLFSTFTGISSIYNYKLESRKDSSSFNSVEYELAQYSLKSDFTYSSSLNHKLEFGAGTNLYELSPGIRKPTLDQSIIQYKEIEKEQALETAVYIGDEFDLASFISFSVGLRYAIYFNMGPKTQFNYLPGISRNSETISDTSFYKKNALISTYSGPEYRLSANLKLGELSSLKLGFNRMYQYINMISNTAAMSPTDIWKLSDKYIKPQMGDQYSFGFYTKLRKNTLDLSIETYYKNLKNTIVYKGGAQLTMNEHIETELLNGSGKAYGFEFMLNKKTGKLTGWINYTYSRIMHKTETDLVEDQVNNGDYFPANYDKPHDFKIIANYKLGRRFNVSANVLYSTGRPFTPPVSYYLFEGSMRVYYAERNSMRIPDYMRLDLAATLNGNLVAKKLNHSSWTFAVYNILGRKNVHNIFFRTENNKVNGYALSIFGQPVYTITYNFRIRGNANDDF